MYVNIKIILIIPRDEGFPYYFEKFAWKFTYCVRRFD